MKTRHQNRSPWSYAYILAALGIAAATACDTDGDRGSTDDDDDDDGVGNTSGSDGGTGGGGGAGGQSTSTGGAGTCNGDPWIDDSACQDCLEQSCCFALNACEPGSDCIAFKDCSDGCAGDVGCMIDCVDGHASGVAAVEAIAACDGDNCQSCATVPPTNFDCDGILSAYPSSPTATCAEDNCCAEVVECATDSSCELEYVLSGDCVGGSLCTCITNECAY